ncbi:MAG: methyl-accepting chemotaxis protein [Oligoflexales bacterium]
MIQSYKQASLTKRILLMLVIPCISYLAMASLGIWVEVGYLNTNRNMRHIHNSLTHISNLIKDLQLERGNSVLFLTSEDRSYPLDRLQSFRSNTDLQVRSFLDSFEFHEDLDSNNYNEVKNSLMSLDMIRKTVESEKNVKKVLGLYKDLIQKLLSFGVSASEVSSSHVASKIKSLLLLEFARENAGLLRAGMSGVINLNLPVEESKFHQLLSQKYFIDSNLNSIALDLSDSVVKDIRNSHTSGHWNSMNRIYQSIVANASEGGYGEDGSETFSVMTKVVDDIGRYIQGNLDFIEATIEEEYEEIYSEIRTILLGILFNITIIYLAASRSISGIKIQLSGLVNSIEKSVDHVTVVSKDLSRTSHSLSSGSQQTAAALQETVSSISEMNSMVSRTLDKSKETKIASEDINEKVGDANATVGDMVESMEDLSQANEKLDEVNGIIRSISKQVKVINDIVFKTQLLAVNASIEAAKAGAHGKGFAVVADEVSKLAQMSGEASENISHLLDDSEDKVTKITKDVSMRVSKGSDTAKSVKNAFNHIGSDVNKIKNLSDDMAQACEEQSLGIEQVTTAIAEIDNATRSNTNEAQIVESHASKLGIESSQLGFTSSDMAFKMLGIGASTQASFAQSPLQSEKKRSTSDDGFTSHEMMDDSGSDDDLADDDSFRPAS